MIKRLPTITAAILLLTFTLSLHAATVTWVGGNCDDNWLCAENWDQGVPTAVDHVCLSLNGTTRIDLNASVRVYDLHVGREVTGTARLQISGGNLNLDNPAFWTMAVGHATSATQCVGVVEQTGGTVFTGGVIVLGLSSGAGYGKGTYLISGGTLTVGTLTLAESSPNAFGHLQIDGGKVIVLGSLITRVGASIDIGNGTILTKGAFDPQAGTASTTLAEAAAQIEAWITEGRITAFGGNGTVHVDIDGIHPGYVTLSASVPNEGLVGHWKLDEGQGTFAADSSGYGNDATVAGTADWDDNRFVFDGATSLVIPGLPAYKQQNRGFTWACWVQTENAAAALMSKGPGAWQTGARKLVEENGVAWHVRYLLDLQSGTSVRDEPREYHVALSVNRARTCIYIDGILAGEVLGNYTSAYDSDTWPITLGAAPGAGNLVGHMRDVRVYSYGLPRRAVRELIDASSMQAVEPLPLDDAEGITPRVTLSWKNSAVPGLQSYDLYLSTVREEVENARRLVADFDGSGQVNMKDFGLWVAGVLAATGGEQPDWSALADFAAEWLGTESTSFVGRLSETSYQAGPLLPDQKYYWRVDGVDPCDPANGVTRGRVWSFTTAAAQKPIIYHLDFTEAQHSAKEFYDLLHVTSCVQGLVNREAPRVYISLLTDHTKWLNRLIEPGGLCQGWGIQPVRSVHELVDIFGDHINGVILYDEDVDGVISTSLVATTAAGVENALAVRKDVSFGSMYKYLVSDADGPQLPVLLDLTGRFTGSGNIWKTATPSTGSAKCDAYIWAKQKYLDSGRSDARYLNYTLDLWGLGLEAPAPTLISSGDAATFQLTYMDYAIAQKAFSFELSPWGDETPNDDPTQPLGTDLQTYLQILNAANVQTSQSEMIKLTGFVNFWYKYSLYAGGSHGDVESEWEQIRLHSAYNVYTEPDTPCNAEMAMANGSFFAGLMPVVEQRRYVQNPAPTYTQMQAEGLIDAAGDVVPGNYILLFFGDYDQPATTFYFLAGGRFDDPIREQINCNWGVVPTLIERASAAVDYMYRNKSAHDFFYSSASGAGYINSPNLYGARNPSGYADATEIWQKHSEPFYRLLDYSISGWVLGGSAGPLTATDAALYSPFSGDGISMGVSYSSLLPSPDLLDNIPILRRLSPDDPAPSDLINYPTGVNFAWYRTMWQYPSQIKALQDSMAESGNNHRFLDMYSFYYLLRHHLGGNNNHRATWVSDTIPRIMTAGQTYSVAVTVRNDGWDTWSGTGGFPYLLAVGFAEAGGAAAYTQNQLVPDGVTVPPSQNITFSFDLTAPATPGEYDCCYDMLHNQITWFHQAQNIPYRCAVIVAENENDIDTDGDGIADVTEDLNGTLYWHPDDQ